MITDKFKKSESLFSTTLSAGISTGTGDTITLASVTGLPTDTEITITIDRVDSNGLSTPSKLERITGTISSNNLTSYTRGTDGTTEQAHSSGAVVEIIWNSQDWNDAVDGILVEHNQDGTHGAITATTGTFSDDVDIASTKNVTYNGSDPYRTITLPAKSWAPTTTSGCASVTQVEAATNDIDYDVLDFDASSDENAYINFQMPDSWNAGTIQFRYVWTTASGGSAETVVFELSGRSFADGDAIDQAVGTAVEVSDTWQADGDIHTSSWSSAVTLAGTPAAGEWVHLEIMRDVSEDDLGGDARLIAVQLRYIQSQFGD